MAPSRHFSLEELQKCDTADASTSLNLSPFSGFYQCLIRFHNSFNIIERFSPTLVWWWHMLHIRGLKTNSLGPQVELLSHGLGEGQGICTFENFPQVILMSSQDWEPLP